MYWDDFESALGWISNGVRKCIGMDLLGLDWALEPLHVKSSWEGSRKCIWKDIENVFGTTSKMQLEGP
eukprot:5812345-Karenia_brevis.AAC.1